MPALGTTGRYCLQPPLNNMVTPAKGLSPMVTSSMITLFLPFLNAHTSELQLLECSLCAATIILDCVSKT